MVLGVTPRSLTPLAQQNNAFCGQLIGSDQPEFADHALGRARWFLRPIGLDRLRRLLVPKQRQYRYQHVFHPDGWVAGVMEPANPQLNLPDYSGFYDNNTVEPQIVQRVLGAVRRWSDRGIRVYGFRPPSTRKAWEIESRYSGFDEEAFAADFCTAGGIWIDVDVDGWSSYDGNHLHKESAMALSRQFGRRIRQIETGTHPVERIARIGASAR